jgi:hypothetical protein
MCGPLLQGFVNDYSDAIVRNTGEKSGEWQGDTGADPIQRVLNQ